MAEPFTRITLASTYRNLPIELFISPGSSRSHTLLVLNPGAFETAWGDVNRYRTILLWLQRNIAPSPYIMGYQTARQPIVPPPYDPTSSDYWQRMEAYWIQAFAGKTFIHELTDVSRAYTYALTHNRIDTIYTLGFSLGGTLGLLLTQRFRQIRKLCLVGSAASTKRPHLPVLTKYPAKSKIFKVTASYRRNLLVLQGTADTVVPQKDAVDILSSAVSAHTAKLVRYRGADHMFSGNNRYGLFEKERLLNEFIHFFQTP
jgi:esterase/lipase